MHPSHKVESIDRAMPREQSRNQHPACGYEHCSLPADFTLKIKTTNGFGYEDLCRNHLTKKLEDSIFAAQVLTAFISERLPR